jgi:tRNA 2-thiouridine synthesizing protein B
MLHLISKSPIDYAVLERISVGDDVVFLENAVLRLLQKGTDKHRLTLLIDNHRIYVLTDALTVCGIAEEELVRGINVIDYVELVALTVKHSVIQSWS